MRYSFRLAELVDYSPDPKRRPGTVKAIVDYTGLDRHQVASLLKNEVKYVPMHALSRLCDYLIESGRATPEQLPGVLFSVEAENFWELLARRKRLEICLGVREPEAQETKGVGWVVAADSLLMGELLNGVSTLGGAAKFAPASDAAASASAERPHLERLQQTLVWATPKGERPGQTSDPKVNQRAKQVYEDFSAFGGDRALVCLGSVKSNPVAELLLANAFGCEPFVSEDNVASASDRHCPIVLRYRAEDPQPDGCSGALRLSQEAPAEAPGFYFEQEDGGWDCRLSDGKRKDAAMVFYIHRESQGRTEMLLGGFSGRATRMLGKTLATQASGFWPPVYDHAGIQVGAFIVKYTFTSGGHKDDLLNTDLSAATEIIPLAESVIARRIQAT